MLNNHKNAAIMRTAFMLS